MGSASEILANLANKDQKSMIEGLSNNNYEKFWEINQALCNKPIGELKKYAIRVMCNKHHTYVQPNIDVNKPTTEGETETNVTLGDILEEQFPRLFEKAVNDAGNLETQKKRDF